MTYCTVKEVSPGLLRFEGDGFNLNMTYNSKIMKPKVEYYEVKDSKLKGYWPKGVTRVVLEYIKPALSANSVITFTAVK